MNKSVFFHLITWKTYKNRANFELHGNIFATCAVMFIISERCHTDVLLYHDPFNTEFVCMYVCKNITV